MKSKELTNNQRLYSATKFKSTIGKASGLPSFQKFLSFFEHVPLRDMVVFSRQFASMVGAGVAMLRTLIIMTEQCENKKLKQTVDSMRKMVESGTSLSDALSKHPDVFDRLFISMVRAGEAGGVLDETLKRIADFLENKEKLSSKVRSAMVYPVAVMCVAITVFWAMLTFILPVFATMFKSLGAELPAYTQFLIDLSSFVRSAWMLLIVIAMVLGFSWLIAWYRTEFGKMQIDTVLLRIPVVGDLIKKVCIARFTRTFSALLRSGVPMLSALEVVKDTSGNAVFMRSVVKIQQEVKQGGNISGQLSKDLSFPMMVTQMVAIGEETGKLDEMLSKIADFYDLEVERAVDAFTSLLEPIMVVGIGGVVGSVVIGMYLPIFTIINQIH